jgi:O-Antigen ligase
LIAAQDMAIAAVPPLRRAPPSIARATALPFTERLLLVVLFITVLASSVAFIEPSPHDFLMGVLLVISLVVGVRIERAMAVPLLLLLVWNFAGLLSLLNVPGEIKTVQYALTSLYLGVAALLFAGLFARDTMPRLTAMRIAYVTTAVIASFLGMAGYFNLFGTEQIFAPIGRAAGAFKDPNVFGPFLIWPALFGLERMLTRHIRITDVVVTAILLFGLLLSFSRGAWFHFGLSATVMVALAFLTAPTMRNRLRIFYLAVGGLIVFGVILVVLLSIPAIGEMFRERAQLLQYYDVGQGGRFRLQELAVAALLKFPNGMGPFGFATAHGTQQHNVYLQGFMVYGWVGGVTYILLLLSTMWVGLRTALIRAPWQPYAITAFAAFVGEVAEGFVIDTDHWRHFFLLLGMVWGLYAATLRQTRSASVAPPVRFAVATR